MFNIFATAETIDERSPTTSPLWVWPGFVIALVFFVLEMVSVFIELEEQSLNLVLTLVFLAGWIYWLLCVQRLHKVLADLTANRYPITPSEALGKHFIPFYNFFYWVFKWPAELSRYLNSRGRVRMISGYVIGALLLVATLFRFVDGAIGLAFLFGVMIYISAKLKRHVKLLVGTLPGDLPPLPDPGIFSRPHES